MQCTFEYNMSMVSRQVSTISSMEEDEWMVVCGETQGCISVQCIVCNISCMEKCRCTTGTVHLKMQFLLFHFQL